MDILLAACVALLLLAVPLALILASRLLSTARLPARTSASPVSSSRRRQAAHTLDATPHAHPLSRSSLPPPPSPTTPKPRHATTPKAPSPRSAQQLQPSVAPKRTSASGKQQGNISARAQITAHPAHESPSSRTQPPKNPNPQPTTISDALLQNDRAKPAAAAFASSSAISDEPCFLLTPPLPIPSSSRPAAQPSPSPPPPPELQTSSTDHTGHLPASPAESRTSDCTTRTAPSPPAQSAPLPLYNHPNHPPPPSSADHQNPENPLHHLPSHSSSPSLPHHPTLLPLPATPSCSSLEHASSFNFSLPRLSPSARSSPSRPSSTLPDKAKHLLATLSIGSTSTSASLAPNPNKVQRSMHKAANKAAAAASAVIDSAKAALARIGSKISSDEAAAPPPPRAMISGKDGDKRAVFRNNKVSPTPVFFALVHPKAAPAPAPAKPAPAAPPRSSTPPSLHLHKVEPGTSQGKRSASVSAETLQGLDLGPRPPALSLPLPLPLPASGSETRSSSPDAGFGSSAVSAPGSRDGSPGSGSRSGDKRRSRASSLTPLQLADPSAAAAAATAALGNITHLPSSLHLRLPPPPAPAPAPSAAPPQTSQSLHLPPLDDGLRLPSTLDLYSLSAVHEPGSHGPAAAAPAQGSSQPWVLDEPWASGEERAFGQQPLGAQAAASTWLPPSPSAGNIWADPWHRSMGLPLVSPCSQESAAVAACWAQQQQPGYVSTSLPPQQQQQQQLSPAAAPWRGAAAADASATVAPSRSSGSLAAAFSALSGAADAGGGGGSFTSAVDFMLKGSGSWDAIASLLEQERAAGPDSGELLQQQQQQRGRVGAEDEAAAPPPRRSSPGQEQQQQMLQMLQSLLAPEGAAGAAPAPAGSAPEQQQQQQQQQQQRQLALYALLQQWQDEIAGQLLEQSRPAPAAAFPPQHWQWQEEVGGQLLEQASPAAAFPPQQQQQWQWQEEAGGQLLAPATAYPQQQQGMDMFDAGPSEQGWSGMPGPEYAPWTDYGQGLNLNSGHGLNLNLNPEALGMGIGVQVQPEPWGGSPGHKKGGGGRGVKREAGSMGAARSPGPGKRPPVGAGVPGSPHTPRTPQQQYLQQQGAGAGAGGSHEKEGKAKGKARGGAAPPPRGAAIYPPGQPPMLMQPMVYGLPARGLPPGQPLLSPGRAQVLAGPGGIPLMVPGGYMQYAPMQDGRGNVVLVPVPMQAMAGGLPMQAMRRLPEVTSLTAAVVQVKHAGAAAPSGGAAGGAGRA